ncbi:MAG: pyruvate kinase [Candidatus Gracilibacteria bacterium]|nr:pyruvate kinase [Candidatus Gracilibacteria bacterium]
MRQTKIIATVGPSCSSSEHLQQLVEAGVSVFRLNFSHGDHSSHGRTINRIRALSKKMKREFPIILDTKGPEIRTADLRKPVRWQKGETVTLTVEHAPYEQSGKIQVNYDDFLNDVAVGDKILVDNGTLKIEVLKIDDPDVSCRVLSGGTLGPRRHLNLPGKSISLDSITEADWKDIEFGIKKGVDFVALSFVRCAEDIERVKAFLAEKKAPIDVIAKIETQSAIDDIAAIVESAHQVMVARGDLGIETSFARVPQLQRDIVKACAEHQTPVIIATHMLESMVEHPTPTRAEVSDVSVAAFQRADATMLSGETAIGAHPIAAVEYMAEIICETEKNFLASREIRKLKAVSDQAGLSKIAAQLPDELENLAAILVVTGSGSTAQLVSCFRPRVPIFSCTDDVHIQRKTQLLWGVEPLRISFSSDPEKTIAAARKALLQRMPEFRGEKVALVSGSQLTKGEMAPTVQIRQV